jgi:hypothetical protein
MDDLSVEILGAGRKNITVQVWGILTKNLPVPRVIFTLEDIGCSKFRFESVVFAVQEKSGFYLWWKGKDSNKSLILPLESRGAFNFEPVQCLHSPPDTVGIALTSFGVDGPKAFRLILDLGAQ